MTGPPEDHGPALNTDRELWRERADDYYAPSIFVTESGGIGITVGGTVFVKPIRAWFALAEAAEPLREAYEGPHGEVLYRPVGLTGPRGTPLDLRAVEARHNIGMPICPNGNTIYCFPPEKPCEGCIRVAQAQADLARLVKEMQTDGRLPPL